MNLVNVMGAVGITMILAATALSFKEHQLPITIQRNTPPLPVTEMWFGNKWVLVGKDKVNSNTCYFYSNSISCVSDF